MIDKQTKLDFGIPFVWIVRFVFYLRPANRAETIIAFRKLGIIGLFYAGWFAWWFIGLGMGGFSPSAVVMFWLVFFTVGISANFYSRSAFTHQTWEGIFYTSQRIPFRHAPDLRQVVITKNWTAFRRFSKEHRITLNEFPLGWSVERGWIWYGFRRPYDSPEVYPHHIAFCGEKGMGIDAMRDLIAMRAFEISADTIFLILDSDVGGINFDMYESLPFGFVVKKTPADCIQTIHYLHQLLLDRRKNKTKRCTQIIVLADNEVSNAFIGRAPASRHYKPVSEAIKTIVKAGKNFGIHLVIFPTPDFYENSVTSYPRSGFSRHDYVFAQYWGTEFEEIKSPEGKVIGHRAIKSPKWGTGLFLMTVQGESILIKDAPPKMAQVMHRIRESIPFSPVTARKLFDQFRHLDFPEYEKLELEQKQEEKPAEPERTRRECPVCSGRGRMLKVSIDAANRIVKFVCLKIKGGCGHKWEMPIKEGVHIDESEGVAIGSNGKNGNGSLGTEIIPHAPNFTEDYHFKS